MKFISRLLLSFVISFTLVHLPGTKAHAGMISTTEAVSQVTRVQGEVALAQFLDRGDIQQKLVEFGVSPEEAKLRLAGLSDQEVQKLNSDIEKATAGGNVVGILVVVLLVLGIIYLARRV